MAATVLIVDNSDAARGPLPRELDVDEESTERATDRTPVTGGS
ncbi:hypothetical protein ACFQGT_16115 [Natrialbaceae archaeon GCM10025810]